MDASKITYYKEVVPYLEKIMEELDKKERGFIFSTCPRADGNTTAKPLSCVRLVGEDSEETLVQFWAGIMSIIEALNREVPEDARPMWRDSFITFVQATAKMCFPNFKFERIKMKGEKNVGE